MPRKEKTAKTTQKEKTTKVTKVTKAKKEKKEKKVKKDDKIEQTDLTDLEVLAEENEAWENTEIDDCDSVNSKDSKDSDYSNNSNTSNNSYKDNIRTREILSRDNSFNDNRSPHNNNRTSYNNRERNFRNNNTNRNDKSFLRGRLSFNKSPKGATYNKSAINSISKFDFNDYRNSQVTLEKATVVDLLKAGIAKTHDLGQNQLKNVLFQTLKATNLECNFPTTIPYKRSKYNSRNFRSDNPRL